MKKFLLAAFMFSLANTQILLANEIHLTSIKNLIEQEIGQIVVGQIYDELNINYTIKPMPGKRAKYETSNGLMDGEVMRIYNYGVVTPNVIRVPTPYYSLETMAFFKSDNKVRITSDQDLSSYRIVVVRGVQHTADITQGLDNVIQLNTTEQVMRFILKGRADIALTNTIDGLRTLKQLKITTIEHAKEPLRTLDLYHYLHKKHKNLIPMINDKIIELKKNKKLSTIIENAEHAVIQ